MSAYDPKRTWAARFAAMHGPDQRSACQSTGYRYDRNQQAENRKEDRGLWTTGF